MYLESFTLPVDREEKLLNEQAAYNGGRLGYVDNPYPCGIFSQNGLRELAFQKMTILYGGNGSGKSTLLNLIAEKLKLCRVSPFNTGETFGRYVENCAFRLGDDDDGCPLTIPEKSAIITSDDVFDYMLAARTNNEEVAETKQLARREWSELKYGPTVHLQGLEDYELLRRQVLSRTRSVSRRKYIRQNAGEETRLHSNGETALEYFETKLENDTFYCLDEPENSLSPHYQQALAARLEEMARYCGCQFVLATHSPFLLAMENARVYDLDASPARVRKWWELENTRAYYEFFKKHRDRFE